MMKLLPELSSTFKMTSTYLHEAYLKTRCPLQHSLGGLGGYIPQSFFWTGGDATLEPPPGMARNGYGYRCLWPWILVGIVWSHKTLANSGCGFLGQNIRSSRFSIQLLKRWCTIRIYLYAYYQWFHLVDSLFHHPQKCSSKDPMETVSDSMGNSRALSRWIFIIFMIIAGVNHFVNPDFYLPLIPDYLPHPIEINIVSGILEIVLALMLINPKLRQHAAWGIILLLMLFIPSHVYFIQIGACIPEGLCTPLWVAWFRLIVIHPLLLLWCRSLKWGSNISFFCTFV